MPQMLTAGWRAVVMLPHDAKSYLPSRTLGEFDEPDLAKPEIAFHAALVGCEGWLMLRQVLIVAASLLLVGGSALAKPKFPTRYTYYSVAGTSAVDVFQSLSRRGPSVKGVSAYATTTANTAQSGKIVQEGKVCRIRDYDFDADFVIKLPRLRNEAALTGPSKSNWRQFSVFLKKHEEEHRTIWLGCGQILKAQIKALRKPTCNAVEREAGRLWTAMRASCQKKHDALDTRDQKALVRHPFIKQVLRTYRGKAKG